MDTAASTEEAGQYYDYYASSTEDGEVWYYSYYDYDSAYDYTVDSDEGSSYYQYYYDADGAGYDGYWGDYWYDGWYDGWWWVIADKMFDVYLNE